MELTSPCEPSGLAGVEAAPKMPTPATSPEVRRRLLERGDDDGVSASSWWSHDAGAAAAAAAAADEATTSGLGRRSGAGEASAASGASRFNSDSPRIRNVSATRSSDCSSSCKFVEMTISFSFIPQCHLSESIGMNREIDWEIFPTATSISIKIIIKWTEI